MVEEDRGHDQHAPIQSNEATEDIFGLHQQDYMSQKAYTNVSTVHEDGFMSFIFNQSSNHDIDEDDQSESGFSQTSYASSSASALAPKITCPTSPDLIRW